MDCSVVTYPWYESTTVGLKSLDMALAEVRSGAVSPEAREIIIMALGNVDVSVVETEVSDDDDHAEPDGDEAEPETPETDERENDTAPTETSEAVGPRTARNLEIARLYLA